MISQLSSSHPTAGARSTSGASAAQRRAAADLARERLLDMALADSFPASDPVSSNACA